jgi:hypothetical protein
LEEEALRNIQVCRIFFNIKESPFDTHSIPKNEIIRVNFKIKLIRTYLIFSAYMGNEQLSSKSNHIYRELLSWHYYSVIMFLKKLFPFLSPGNMTLLTKSLEFGSDYYEIELMEE